MNITHQWKIIELERRPSDGAVITAHWECVSTEHTADVKSRSYGATSFVVPAAPPDFIPFEQLDEETVLGWIWSKENNKQSIEQTNEMIIDQQINPPVISGLPW